jgi:hypothetical protein
MRARKTPKTAEAQRLLASLDAELEAAAKRDGRELVWSAQERDIIRMIGAQIDRRVELSAAYDAAEEGSVAQIRIATELRLLEQAIARLYKQVSTDLPAPMSSVSLKAQRAARTRWDRERMRQSAN